MTLLSDPVLRVLADFRKNDEGRLEGVVKTLLPNTRYQFQIYALNSMNYNQPSDYSYPIRTPTLESSGEFSFSASVSEGKTTSIKNKMKFSKCSVSMNVEQRKYAFIVMIILLGFESNTSDEVTHTMSVALCTSRFGSIERISFW